MQEGQELGPESFQTSRQSGPCVLPSVPFPISGSRWTLLIPCSQCQKKLLEAAFRPRSSPKGKTVGVETGTVVQDPSAQASGFPFRGGNPNPQLPDTSCRNHLRRRGEAALLLPLPMCGFKQH